MKKTVFFLCALLPLYLSAQVSPKLVDPKEMPNGLHFLPPPPDTLSAGFAYDLSQYHWGKSQRNDSVRCAIATRDAEWSVPCMCREFSEPFGVTLSKENTPEIYLLLEMVAENARHVASEAKDHYMRKRPYVRFHEGTIAPWDEEDLRNNGSYPSGHTILGWSTALILTELNPDRQDTLLARGYMYGESRVIAGFHWQSDVNAGFLCASAAIARLHANDRFQEQIRKAKEEFLKKKSRK